MRLCVYTLYARHRQNQRVKCCGRFVHQAAVCSAVLLGAVGSWMDDRGSVRQIVRESRGCRTVG